MEINVSPVVKKPTLYGFEYKKLRGMLRIKKTAQRYDDKGEKIFKLQDHVAQSKKSAPVILKHEKIQGPFALVLYKTDSAVQSGPGYTYQGYIKVDEGEFAYVYRDTLEDYPDAKWCDDTTLFMDVRNKDKGEKYAVQIDGEPTSMECWQFDDAANDTKDHFFKKQMEAKKKEVAEQLNLPEEKVAVIIQLDL